MSKCLSCKLYYCQYCKPFELCIIGGGISGLYLADKFMSCHKQNKIIILEQNKIVGGRIKTQYDPIDKKVLFEKGPWRIHEKHKKTIKLCKKLKVPLGILSSSSLHANNKIIKKKHTYLSIASKYYNNLYNSFFSQWEFLSLFYSPEKANNEAQYSGYGDKLYNQMIHGNSYRVIDNKNNNDVFYYVKKGLSSLVYILKKKIEKKRQNIIKTNHKVMDVIYDEISKLYTIYITKRDDNYFHKYSIQSKKLCIAIPPRLTRHWSIYKHLRLSFSLLDTTPLLHIYTNINPLFLQQYIGTTHFHIKHNGICSQFISSNYGNNLVQVCYTGGKNAVALHRLNLKNPELLYTRIVYDLANLLNIDRNIIRKNVSHKLHVCYYPHAVHFWKPHSNQNKYLISFLATTFLHPTKLPYCYCIGEAVSTIQGWIEGALETCDLVFDELINDRIQKYCNNSNNILNINSYVLYDNWIINVLEWISRHPGGKTAILNYKQQDITQLFHFVDHSKQALNILSGFRTHIQYKDKCISISQLFKYISKHQINK